MLLLTRRHVDRRGGRAGRLAVGPTGRHFNRRGRRHRGRRHDLVEVGVTAVRPNGRARNRHTIRRDEQPQHVVGTHTARVTQDDNAAAAQVGRTVPDGSVLELQRDVAFTLQRPVKFTGLVLQGFLNPSLGRLAFGRVLVEERRDVLLVLKRPLGERRRTTGVGRSVEVGVAANRDVIGRPPHTLSHLLGDQVGVHNAGVTLLDYPLTGAVDRVHRLVRRLLVGQLREPLAFSGTLHGRDLVAVFGIGGQTVIGDRQVGRRNGLDRLRLVAPVQLVVIHSLGRRGRPIEEHLAVGQRRHRQVRWRLGRSRAGACAADRPQTCE